MGKYMRKSKVTGDVVAVVEVPTAAGTLGVRTRARTLALQKLNSSSSSSPSPPPPPPLPSSSPAPSSSSLCYLQLRSRRLQKPATLVSKEKPREELPCEAEASFGDNCLDSDPTRDRSTRESTPCTSIRDSNATGIPGSTTRKTCSRAANRRVSSDGQRNIPSTSEMEEFFAIAERQQQRLFREKYNFDVVNDCPLPGRYEWVQVVP